MPLQLCGKPDKPKRHAISRAQVRLIHRLFARQDALSIAEAMPPRCFAPMLVVLLHSSHGRARSQRLAFANYVGAFSLGRAAIHISDGPARHRRRLLVEVDGVIISPMRGLFTIIIQNVLFLSIGLSTRFSAIAFALIISKSAQNAAVTLTFFDKCSST